MTNPKALQKGEEKNDNNMVYLLYAGIVELQRPWGMRAT
jgi:hypothetical protein